MNAPPAIVAPPALAPLQAELARLDLLIEREILRLRARYELSLDEFRGLYISDRQVDELLARARPVPAAPAPPEPPGDGDDSPWARLARGLGLARAERDLLLLGFAPELDTKYETLYAYLNNDVTRKWPTFDLAARLFGTTPAARLELRTLLAPEARLLARGLLEPVAAVRDLPRSQRGYRIAAPLADWLLGLPYSDERLVDVARVVTPTDDPGLSTSTRELLERAARWIASGERLPVIGCSAADAADAAIAAKQIFARAGSPVLLVDLRAAVRASADAVNAARALCSVLRTPLIAGPAEALLDRDQRPTDAVDVVRRLAAGVDVLLVTGASAAVRRVLHACEAGGRGSVELCVPEASTAERAAAWRAALTGRAGADAPVALADRFALGRNQIRRVVRLAGHAAELEGGELRARLFEAARTVSAEGSDELTRPVSTALGWDDLVVPPAVRAKLDRVVRAIELRPRVLDEWGFAQRITGARGAKILFSGVSGTGKTLAAAIIANKVGLPLHKIQTTVLSKYIGETELNISRAFDSARRANAILFIDEAEALLGKRSETKDAHDHWVNSTVGHVLQKMEEDCLVILATNLRGNLDEAFSRRMHYVVDFPMPDAASRERLWRGMFPAGAPLAADVDFSFLARQFVFAGGDIRNIVLDAAYQAAQAGQTIAMRHLLQAVARQYTKQSKLPSASEFREYFRTLEPEPTS